MKRWGWLPNTDGIRIVRATPAVGGALATFMSWSRSQARSVAVSTGRKKDHSLCCGSHHQREEAAMRSPITVVTDDFELQYLDAKMHPGERFL
jgi:hypothetical protein